MTHLKVLSWPIGNIFIASQTCSFLSCHRFPAPQIAWCYTASVSWYDIAK